MRWNVFPACFALSIMSWLSWGEGRVVVGSDPVESDWPVVLCPVDNFYSMEQEKCQPCSPCPTNNIIRQPCKGLRDTVCGPFYEFTQFRPSRKSKDNSGKLQRGRNADNESMTSRAGSDADAGGKSSSGGSDPEVGGRRWREVAVALIVVAAVIVVFVVVLVGVCYFRRKDRGGKQVVCEYSPPPVQV